LINSVEADVSSVEETVPAPIAIFAMVILPLPSTPDVEPETSPERVIFLPVAHAEAVFAFPDNAPMNVAAWKSAKANVPCEVSICVPVGSGVYPSKIFQRWSVASLKKPA